MPLSTFKRYELKFLLTLDQQSAILPEIEKYMSPDKYCTDGRHYSIYNLYFDNDSDSVIQSSVRKPFFKEKLRLRSYLPSPNENDPVFIELKRKINKTVTKRRACLTYSEALDYIHNNKNLSSNNYIDNQVLREIDYFREIYNVYPKVFIRYDRRAYYGKEDSSLRLTFDKNIITRRENLLFNGDESGQRLIGENERLMEVKIAGGIPLWLTRTLEKNGIRQDSFSKYGNEYKAEVNNGNI